MSYMEKYKVGKEIQEKKDILKSKIRELEYDLKELQEQCPHFLAKNLGSPSFCIFCEKIFYGQ